MKMVDVSALMLLDFMLMRTHTHTNSALVCACLQISVFAHTNARLVCANVNAYTNRALVQQAQGGQHGCLPGASH